MIKYHTQVSYKLRNLFLTVLEDGKSKIKMPADLTSGENLLPGLEMNSHPLTVSSHSRKGEGAPGSLF